MNRPRSAAVMILAALSSLISACTVGPEYVRPATTEPPQWYAPLPHGGNAELMTTWWAQFDDTLLSELIDAAQRDNPQLDGALARLAQSRADVSAARATLLPGVDGNALWQRGNGELGEIQVQNLALPALSASWEIDLFGAKRRGRDAAQARYEGAQASWHDARVSLAAEVAQEYVGLRMCQVLANDYDEDLRSRRESARLTHLKVDAGFATPADDALAAASASSAAARLNTQRAECDIGVKALVALTGLAEPELRGRLADQPATLPTPALFAVPLLPAQTLEQRPDIAAAERELAAASAEIGVAEAARYPSLTLTGSLGLPTLQTANTRIDGRLWSFGPALGLPIFDGGLSAANAASARARYAEARAGFTARARQAVREVEQALVRLNSASTREDDVRSAAEGYEKVFVDARNRWSEGACSLLDLEETRRVAVASRTQWLSVQGQRVLAWISLYRALGGGWSPPAAAAQRTADAR